MKTEKQQLLNELIDYWLDDLVDTAETQGWMKAQYDLGGFDVDEKEYIATLEKVRILRRKILLYWREINTIDKQPSTDNWSLPHVPASE